MKYRKLRIAWSVAWGVVAVLLCVFWVRSYWRVEAIDSSLLGWHVLTQSYPGGVWIDAAESEFVPVEHYRWMDFEDGFQALTPHFDLNPLQYLVPYWMLLAIAISFIAVPWLRFRLRTLLIATTLVAVGLGIIVWMSRAG